jgi:putative FmdB family regulatory protein
MPIYEYSCHRCGKRLEFRQKFADEPLKVHEECGGELERLISAPSLHFKGTGWYVTDYAKGGASPPTPGSNGSSDSKNSDSKSETKPAAKTESKTESKSESNPAPAKT